MAYITGIRRFGGSPTEVYNHISSNKTINECFVHWWYRVYFLECSYNRNFLESYAVKGLTPVALKSDGLGLMSNKMNNNVAV